MDFFERMAAEKNKKTGQYKAFLTAKWVNLSRIKTPERELDFDSATEFLAKDKTSAKLIKKHFTDFTVEFDDASDLVSNVTIDEWRSGGLSEDTRSIKWVEVTFHFDTTADIKQAWSDIEDCLRFNFYFDLEVENSKGYIVFQYADWEDNSIELLES